MNRVLLALLILHGFVSSSWGFEDYHSIALEANNHRREQMDIYMKDAKNAEVAARKLIEMVQVDALSVVKRENGSRGKSGERKSGLKTANKPNPSILIFVSFSMPALSLGAYLRDAKKIHASVVIRGLIDNSFQKTFQRVASLIKESGGDGIELNPLWFKRFGIKTVPAVVLVPEGSSCLAQEVCKEGLDYDVISGDITLSAALKQIRDHGKVTSSSAQSALLMLQGTTHD